MFADWPLLSIVIWLPILGGVFVLATGSDKNAAEARILALCISIITFVLSIPLYTDFNSALASMQFVESVPWIPAFGINYAIGIDGFAMPLIILTSFSTVIVVIAGWEVIKVRVAQYMAAFLIMEGLMIGVFAAMDAALFYVFWEAMLIPMFIVIGVWGGERRVYATLKFFLYTFIGSVLMLVAFLYLYSKTGTFSIADFHNVKLDLDVQIYIFLAFLSAFAVKVPMWPVHTWLPDAHVEAPTGGSVILAAIMLKLGTYGFIRFSLPITPDASHELDWLMITLALISIFYIGFVALVQKDMKKLIAYSSISHMGFVILGFFIVFNIYDANTVMQNPDLLSGAALGMSGAVVQMVSHGFISAAMFLCVGIMYDRMHSRLISDYGGVVNTMPTFAAFMVFFAMANAGLPGTSGFVGEFMVILASFKANIWFAIIAATTLIIGAAYTLWMIKRVIFGEIANEKVAKLTDVNKREFFFLSLLAVMVLGFGLYPAPLLEVMDASVNHLLTQVMHSKL